MLGCFINSACAFTKEAAMSSIIELRQISFSYPHYSREILKECSLSIEKGELISILGPNGAGKSTLLNCACGLLVPQSGDVFVGGRSIRSLQQKEIAKSIGYVQQTQKSSFAHTVFDYVLMGRACNVGFFKKPSAEDYKIAEEALEMMGLSEMAEAAITEISGGERQQAAIARAVAQQPKVIMFDEPTSHLDYGNQIKTLRLIRNLQKQGFAIVMTTHNPDHCMMLGGQVAILDRNGFLENGLVSEVLTQNRLQEVYNTNLHLEYIGAVGRLTCIPCGL